MSDNEWGGTGYGKTPPKQGGSDLFYLASVGQQATLRLATDPYLYTDSGTSKAGKSYSIPKVAWGAILKLDSANPSEGPRAVVLQEASDVYEAVGKLFMDPAYGDPGKYDIILTKVERGADNGWISATVDASTTKDTGLTDAEIAMLTEAQCLTVGQVEATILRIKSGTKKVALTPTAAPMFDKNGEPLFDPFASK